MGRSRAVLVAACSLLIAVACPVVARATDGPGPVCDHQPAEHEEAPPGAVSVDPGVDGDLSAKTAANPPGTTFWLRPGTHTLGTDEFGQVAPKDGDVYLGAPGAVVDGRGVNRAAFTQRARDVELHGLTIRGFTALQDQGVVNHDSGDGWLIENTTIEDNAGAGLMAGARQVVRHSCLRNNGQYGLNAYQAGDGITGLVLEGNEITGNNTGDWEAKVPGCGCSGGAKFWAVNGADITGNWVHGNHGAGLWADTNNNDFLVEDNLFEANDAEALFYETSYNLVLRGNTFRRNTVVQGRAFAARGDNFPAATVYLSESGGEPRVPARTSSIDISGNTFEDNWAGITVWENADRFCNSPANTSTGYCTKVAAKSSCVAGTIEKPPAYDDCRWKTQRVEVHGNTFRFDPGRVGCTGFCGRMALLSNYGTFPDWSPYKGTVVEEAITFRQDNRWHGNSYAGPWTFVVHDTSKTVDAAGWRAGPYSQDECSSFDGGIAGC
ncbi:right-handed parallel beta-helix repeat-containing protein [Amycolatopsis sp. NPDC098790]|uniref:right-handed parallel beta-helix repeat-containing protein n=1 Tax=Amycolatopsis sp. NPDC098790 TaxID=3363939 RepID=UPI00380507F8